MVLACHQFNAVDQQGNIAPGASVEVIRESSGLLAPLYSDRAGTLIKANPFTADANGFAQFFTTGGAYKITVTRNGSSQVWRYVGVGTAAEVDAGSLVSGLVPRGQWVTATTYAGATDVVVNRGSSYFCTTGHLSDSLTEPGVGVNWSSVWTILAERGGSDPKWRFDSATVMADPGTGDIRFNSATLASVTSIAISSLSTEQGNPDFSGWQSSWGDSTSATKGYLILHKVLAPEQYAIFAVTSQVENGGWSQLTVTYTGSSGALFANTDLVYTSFSRTGDVGNPQGFTWSFNSSTAATDPGPGAFRLNHASPALATLLILDDTTNATGNPDASAYVTTWADSTSAIKGFVLLSRVEAPQNFALYQVTGIANNTGYIEVSVTHVVSNGTMAGSTVITYYRTGDKGDEGPPGSGGGGASFSTTPQGRLTYTSGNPIQSASVTGVGTVYYTPFTGQFVPLYDGTSSFVMTDILAELSNILAQSSTGKAGPAAAIASKNYDLFVWDDAGTIRLTRGPTWSTDTSRGTGVGTTELENLKGLLVNKQAITNGPAARRGTYVGTFRTSTSGGVTEYTNGSAAVGGGECRYYLWNAYNRLQASPTVTDNVVSYTYNSPTTRAMNNSAGNRISFITGVAVDPIQIVASIPVRINASSTCYYDIAVGLDSTTTSNKFVQASYYFNSINVDTSMLLIHQYTPQLGFHFISQNEFSSSTPTCTVYGQVGRHLLTGTFWL